MCVVYYILLLFRGEKFRSLMLFLSFPEKRSQLTVTLPILATLDSNIHSKNFCGDKAIHEIRKTFHSETKTIFSTRLYSVCIVLYYVCMCACVYMCYLNKIFCQTYFGYQSGKFLLSKFLNNACAGRTLGFLKSL